MQNEQIDDSSIKNQRHPPQQQTEPLIHNPLQQAEIEVETQPVQGLQYAYWCIKHGRKKKCPQKGWFKMWQMPPEYRKLLQDRENSEKTMKNINDNN